MRLMSIDQSTKISAYAIWDDKELYDYGHVNSDIEENLPIERMKVMVGLLKDVVSKYNPDFIVIENVQFQRNYNTFQQLSQLQGVLFKLFFDMDIGFIIIEPTAWKTFCGIKGKKRIEQKANTIEMMSKKFGKEFTEDEADAVGIGLWAINKIKEKINI